MAVIQSVRGFTPRYGTDCFFADNCRIIGDVVLGSNCSVWFNAVLRGDVNSIRIGNNVNIQDGAVLHTLYERSVVDIGDNVTIAHNAVVHGARISPNVLVGIGAVILDFAEIGENSIIAAGAVVLSRTIVEPGSIYGGNPARKIKDVDPVQSVEMIRRIAEDYKMYAGWYTKRNKGG